MPGDPDAAPVSPEVIQAAAIESGDPSGSRDRRIAGTGRLPAATGRRRRATRRQAQDATREPGRQEPEQEAGCRGRRGSRRDGCRRDADAQAGVGVEWSWRPSPWRRSRLPRWARARRTTVPRWSLAEAAAEAAGPDEPGRRRRVERRELCSDVGVARRLRPPMMTVVRYTASARGRLSAFSASETSLV